MQPDFVIVGAGVIGMTTALALQQNGAKVLIVEKGLAGRESSWAGGGILAPLAPWEEREEVVKLALRSGELFPEFTRRLKADTDIDPEFHVCGLLSLTPTDIARKLTSFGAYGISSRTTLAHDIVAMLPSGLQALWLPNIAQIRPPRFLAALRKCLAKLDVPIIENVQVTAWKIRSGKIVAIEAKNETINAGNFVCCAGAWSSDLLRDHSGKLKIEPVRGQMLLFKTAPGALKTILVSGEVYCIPRLDGHVLVGTTLEDVGFDDRITVEAKEKLLAAAQGILPELNEKHLVDHWSGLRPAAAHQVPVIAQHPEFMNLYVNAGHFRYGVTMAPGSARLLASIALGSHCDFDANLYRWPT